MVKAADALEDAGHAVRLVSTQFLDWASQADHVLGETPVEINGRRWSSVDYRRSTAPSKYWSTGLRFRAARKWVGLVGAGRASLGALAAASGRAYRDLLKLALSEPADLFYGGTSGGLAVAAQAARSAGVPYALDLEDFHEGEFERGSEWDRSRDLVSRLQRELLPGAAFVTAGSSAIAAQYEQAYGIRVVPIHNTFPLPSQAPDPEPPGDGALRLYWFSQTIGAGRGLEDVVRAIGLAGIGAELHLRGREMPEYVAGLRRLASEASSQLAVHVHQPGPPDKMVELSLPYDVGLSPEQGRTLNNRLCLGNKPLTYILAGLAVVITDSPGQRPFTDDLGDGALRYQAGDIASLANGLRRWAEERGLLRHARQAAWQAAKRRWNWQHPSEKGALIEAVSGAVR
jgi:glycosyltransferase involved in cell wall biosynthesis